MPTVYCNYEGKADGKAFDNAIEKHQMMKD
jgi:hypothetical protein